jgi:hypothetical protein
VSRFFHRSARLTLTRPLTPTSFFARAPNALIINAGTKQGIKLTFKITKQLGKEPNTCEINVFNLNETHRLAFTQLPTYVDLDVGYDGQLARLFTGDLGFAFSTKEGHVDWKTVLQCHDGARAYNEARISKAYRGSVDARTAVTDVVQSMGLRMPTSLADAAELKQQFVSGLTLHGKSSAELTNLLKPHGMDWSIQNGQMQILRPNDTRPDFAYLISQKTGMVDSPEYNAPKKPKDKRLVKVRALLKNPSLLPGGTIKLESERINGYFRIEKIEMSGDTEKDDWYAEIEAQPLT